MYNTNTGSGSWRTSRWGHFRWGRAGGSVGGWQAAGACSWRTGRWWSGRPALDSYRCHSYNLEWWHIIINNVTLGCPIGEKLASFKVGLSSLISSSFSSVTTITTSSPPIVTASSPTFLKATFIRSPPSPTLPLLRSRHIMSETTSTHNNHSSITYEYITKL